MTVANVKALTFDVFGTVLDLGTSLMPSVKELLQSKGYDSDRTDEFWDQWRGRQRLEQFQDSLMALGHSGYLETARRALVYVMRSFGMQDSTEDVRNVMSAWQNLSPFADVAAALPILQSKYDLVVLSNGEPEFLQHLAANRIQWDFDRIISVSTVGVFKPHPAVYRRAAAELSLEVGECMMISSNSFDVVGARACGFRAAFVNRYSSAYEDTPYMPDVEVADFDELATALVG